MAKLFERADMTTAQKTLRLFWQEILRDKRTFWTYTTLIPINKLLYFVILPLLFSLIIQSLITQPDNWQYPSWLLGIGVVVSIVAGLTAHFGFKILFNSEEELRTRLTKRAIDALLRHSDQFFGNRKVGTLAGDVNTFSHSILSFLDLIYLHACALIVNFVASLIVIAFLSPILLIPLGLATGFIVWRSVSAVNARSPLRNKRKILSAALNGTVADILGNQQIVRYFAGTKKEVTRVMQDRKEIQLVADQEIDIIQHEMSVRQGILFTFQLLTIGIGMWLFIHDMVSIAALIFAVTYLGRLAGSMFDITPIIRGMEQVFVDSANITEILDEKPEVTDKKHASELSVSKGGIVIQNVAFHYSDHNEKVIDIDNFSIAPGERIGLAGHSGGGKSTLTKLLLRFSDVTAGSIEIDGQDIRDVSQESLRKSIAYVPQEPYLFHRSLRENIAYAKPNAKDKDIWNAVKRANAYEFIKKLPDGLDTIVGERGVKLSGGQRQRIAIARAILKDAPILILDEATSALDSKSEKLIQGALEKLMKGRTSVVVAHRLSTISSLDRIVILEKGQITEEGTHDKLLEKGGVYAELWAHQSGGLIE